MRGLLRRCSVQLASESEKKALAYVEGYFSSEDRWADPWSPVLNPKHFPPTPQHFGKAVDWSGLGAQAIDACTELMMPQDRFEQAMKLRKELEECLRKDMNEKGLRLYTFGSCMSGLGTKSSDLDLVIMRTDIGDGKTETVSANPESREEQINHLTDYMLILERHGIDDLKLIQARVPILRREVDEGVSFDVSLLFHGVRNSILLREYVRTCPFFLPMSIVLREWGKRVDINNSMHGYLTPYCINVMLVKYLAEQVSREYYITVPPLLPPEYYPQAPSRYLPPADEMANRRKHFVHALGLHLAGFLRYYACFAYSCKKISAASPFNDDRVSDPMWRDTQGEAIIEEMYAPQDASLPIPNMSHQIDAIKLLSIREKLFYAYLHAVKHGFLAANPSERDSPAWDWREDDPPRTPAAFDHISRR